MTKESDKALEEKAREWERQCWSDGPGLGRSDYEALLVLLREVAEEAKRGRDREWAEHIGLQAKDDTGELHPKWAADLLNIRIAGAKREEAAEWEQVANSVKTEPYHASGWSLACDEILRRRGGKG